jgi:aminoglycoside phosphotransferase (APT) family kinase protein
LTGSVEEGWQRGYPVLALDAPAIAQLIGAPVHSAVVLAGGLRNTNYRVRVSDGDAVLRLYVAEAAACPRELALLRLLHGQVPVPRVLDGQPNATPPWALLEFVAGDRFDHALPEAIADHACAAGAVLAAIHAVPLETAAHVDLNRYSGPQYGIQEMVQDSLGHGRGETYLGADLTRRVLDIVAEHAPRLSVQDTTLQHSDYKPWNLLVRDRRVAAVLDWEFAFAGPRLNDVGNFIRYSDRHPREYMTRFADGYQAAGGWLPADWFELARLQDLISLGYFLERAGTDPAIARDVVPLIERTVQLFSTP